MEQTIDYWKMFADLMDRRAKLIRQRDEAEIELAKIKPLITSVFAMLPEDRQKANQQAIDDMEAESAGLQDAIKLVFSTREGQCISASSVREYLSAMGFDFRQYKANPLASIVTTLKRIADSGYIEPVSTPHGMMYRRDSPWSALAGLTGLDMPGTRSLADLSGDDSVQKLGKGVRFPKRVGDVTGPTSAQDSGMLGNERPRKK
ncbi:MAG TPA: hypothetical protein VMF10_11810 [Candidatus Aquilonibacter sp.]|nr:hypothetical protein [Candidatus Aquilonibacter sp.]